MSDDRSGQSETGTHESGGVAVDRRNLLQALGAGSLAAAELSGVSGAQDAGANAGESGFVETKDEQSATVSGVVQDAQNNDPLSGVTVEFVETESGQEFSVDTNSAEEGEPGEYSISLPVDGATEYEITVDTDGYEEFTDETTLSPDETRNKDISLPPLDTTATVEYTLTVTDSTGDFEQSVSIEDATDLSEYGEHIGFGMVGHTRDDNDSSIIDQVQLGTGETVEDWEDEGDSGGWTESYHRTNSGGGEFQVVGSPTSGGEYALQLYSGCCGDTITSDEAVLSVDPGITVSADIRHQTDNSEIYAHITRLSLGTDIDGNGGIILQLINPGSKRTAGARLLTPNAEGRIEFDPKLNEFYEFSITIGQAEPPNPDPTGTVTGQVTDTLGPLADVSLEFVPSGADAPTETITTDDSGDYEVELPVDNYVITALEEGYDQTEVPVSVEEDTTSTVDIELTAVNPPVKILSTEVGPENLLSGTDTDIAFFVGVATSDEADVEVDEVDVLEPYTDDEISAQQITDVDGVTLRESLQQVTNKPAATILFPVDFAKELLNLPAKQIYHVSIPSGPAPLKNGDNRFKMRVTGSDGTTDVVGVDIPQYSQGDRLASFNTTAFGPDVDFTQNFFDFDREIEVGEDNLPDNLPVDLAVSMIDVDLEYTGDGSLNLNTLAATAASRSAGGISILQRAGVEFQFGGRWDGTTNDFSYNLNLVDLWLAGLLQTPVPLPKKLKLQTKKIPRIGKVKFKLALSLLPSGYLLLGNSDPNTPGIETATSVSNNSDTADTRTVQSANAQFPVSEREFNTYFTIEATAEGANNNQGNNNQNNGAIKVEAFVSGYVYQGNDINLDGVIEPPTGPLPLEPVGGEVCLDGGVKFSILNGAVSATLSIGSIADFMGWEPCVPMGEIRDPPCWEVFNIDGNCQEYPSPSSLSRAATGYDISDSDVGYGAATGQNPPADAFTAETEAAALTRLTDRAEIDGSPAIAARMSADEQDEHLAVWERHPEDTAAEDGRALVTAIRDGTGWSDPTTLADTTAAGKSYHEPAVATDAGTAAIAWTRYETEGADTPPPLDEATQIELIVEDDTGWSDPVVVAETSDWFDSTPAIAPLGDGWVVAWEREKLDNNTRAVGYAVLDATGAVQRSETITEATQLGVTQFGTGVGDATVGLGYYDRATQQVRRDLITQSDRTTDQTYDLADGLSVRDLSIAAQDTAWLVTDEETTTGFYATGTSVEELPFVSLESSLSSLNLVETIAGPVLTAARAPEEDVRERSFIYRLRDGDSWRPEQVPVATNASEDVKLTESAVAPMPGGDGDGLVSLVEAKVHDPEAVSDIAAVEQPLRPNYSITAEADQETVPPGEQMTVSYTIENTGDLNGAAIGDDPVMVEARSQGNTLADQQESPLARGETATGELTFTVDETGTVDIVVGRELDLLDPEEQRTTIEGSTPLLSVNSVAVERPDEGTAIGTVQIRNGGPVDAQDFDIEVYAGDDTLLAEAQVNGPAAGERSAVTVEFEPGELVLTGSEQIHIDPDEQLPESHVTERVSPVLLGQPDVTVDDEVEYGETGMGAIAMLNMTNAGPVSAQVLIRAVPADATPDDGSFADEDILGTAETTLPAGIDGTPQSADVAVTLEGVAYGDEIRFIVESERPVAGAGIPVVYDRVGPFGAVAPPLPGYSDPPQDLDGDGLYEDLDGDGQFDIFDVQALFSTYQSDAVQQNSEFFDFDGDGQVDIFDVQNLFNRL